MGFTTIGMILVAYLVQGIVFGVITMYLSESKGYNGGFAWGFWLGIIGLLVVGFRPNLAQARFASERNAVKETWTCSCGSKNSVRLNYCPICRKTRRESEDRKCPHCGVFNRATRDVCWSCEKPLRVSQIVPATQENPAKRDKDGAALLADKPVRSEAESARWLDVLERLARLREQGALTDEEFRQKKEDVLRRV